MGKVLCTVGPDSDLTFEKLTPVGYKITDKDGTWLETPSLVTARLALIGMMKTGLKVPQDVYRQIHKEFVELAEESYES